MPRRRVLVQVDAVGVAVVLAGVLGALVVLAVFRAAPTTVTQLAVGALIGLALDPVVLAIRRRLRCSRMTAAVALGTLLAVGFAGVVALLGPRAVEQAEQFAEELPDTVAELYEWPVVGSWLEDRDAVGRVEDFVDELPRRLDDETLADIAGRVVGGVGTLLVVLVTAVAVMFDGDAIVARSRRLVPPARRERADEVGRIVYRSLGKYFAGSLTVALLNGFVILSAGLLLGIPLAFLAGVWAAITNLIPQVGGFLGGAFFVLLATTQGPLTGAIALIVFLSYQQLENNVIQPSIVGKAVNLSPPTTMLAALVGGAAAGVPGALAATPMLGALKSVYLDTRGQSPADDRDRDDGGVRRRLERWRRRLPF